MLRQMRVLLAWLAIIAALSNAADTRSRAEHDCPSRLDLWTEGIRKLLHAQLQEDWGTNPWVWLWLCSGFVMFFIASRICWLFARETEGAKSFDGACYWRNEFFLLEPEEDKPDAQSSIIWANAPRPASLRHCLERCITSHIVFLLIGSNFNFDVWDVAYFAQSGYWARLPECGCHALFASLPSSVPIMIDDFVSNRASVHILPFFRAFQPWCSIQKFIFTVPAYMTVAYWIVHTYGSVLLVAIYFTVTRETLAGPAIPLCLGAEKHVRHIFKDAVVGFVAQAASSIILYSLLAFARHRFICEDQWTAKGRQKRHEIWQLKDRIVYAVMGAIFFLHVVYMIGFFTGGLGSPNDFNLLLAAVLAVIFPFFITPLGCAILAAFAGPYFLKRIDTTEMFKKTGSAEDVSSHDSFETSHIKLFLQTYGNVAKDDQSISDTSTRSSLTRDHTQIHVDKVLQFESLQGKARLLRQSSSSSLHSVLKNFSSALDSGPESGPERGAQDHALLEEIGLAIADCAPSFQLHRAAQDDMMDIAMLQKTGQEDAPRENQGVFVRFDQEDSVTSTDSVQTGCLASASDSLVVHETVQEDMPCELQSSTDHIKPCVGALNWSDVFRDALHMAVSHDDVSLDLRALQEHGETYAVAEGIRHRMDVVASNTAPHEAVQVLEHDGTHRLQTPREDDESCAEAETPNIAHPGGLNASDADGVVGDAVTHRLHPLLDGIESCARAETQNASHPGLNAVQVLEDDATRRLQNLLEGIESAARAETQNDGYPGNFDTADADRVEQHDAIQADALRFPVEYCELLDGAETENVWISRDISTSNSDSFSLAHAIQKEVRDAAKVLALAEAMHAPVCDEAYMPYGVDNHWSMQGSATGNCDEIRKEVAEPTIRIDLDKPENRLPPKSLLSDEPVSPPVEMEHCASSCKHGGFRGVVNLDDFMDQSTKRPELLRL